jgi:hypothetical protein
LFLYRFTYNAHSMTNDTSTNHHWFNTFHLQLVAIPLSVLSIVTVGTRFWTEVVTHVMFLTVSCNALFMEHTTQDKFITKFIFRLIYTGIPLYCIVMAHSQWGNFDNWRYVVGLMGSFSTVATFWLSPWLIFTEDDKSTSKDTSYQFTPKQIGKISLFATSASLLSLVVNLAMFYDD